MTQLTLLNARRGGETGRLQTDDWREEQEDDWIDAQRSKTLSDNEKMLINSIKIA